MPNLNQSTAIQSPKKIKTLLFQLIIVLSIIIYFSLSSCSEYMQISDKTAASVAAYNAAANEE